MIDLRMTVLTERERRGYTQKAVAQMAGVSTATVWNVEAGRGVSWTLALRILEALGIELKPTRQGGM